MEYKQLSLFLDDEIMDLSDENVYGSKTSEKESTQRISDRLMEGFDYMSIPFLGCDFDRVYPAIGQIIPQEPILFDLWGQDVMLMAELVCVGICHQMNWDFLRNAVFQKLKSDCTWIYPNNLSQIQEKDVLELFKLYNRPERIRSEERTHLLREIGRWCELFEKIEFIFKGEDGNILSKEILRQNILQCEVFANDPEEKKMQLLLQKLSLYNNYKELVNYSKPAVDYHLIRSFLRRGLIFAKKEYAKVYLKNQSTERKETTVAAVRHLCSKVMQEICMYTDMDVTTINQIEWHIGRSICLQDGPDCNLEKNESQWLRPYFSECPFCKTCVAKCSNSDLLKLNEPIYKGKSY